MRRETEAKPESEINDMLVPGGIFKCSTVVKGGRRFSFGALVAVGDGKGRVGVGYGKAKEVPMSIQKAIKIGNRNLILFPLAGDGTIPHTVHGRYGAAHVILVPAGPGTGVIAGSTVKTILEMGGIRNVLTKSFGSTNRKNLIKATLKALQSLRNRESIESLRGVKLS
ncbi:MAG: 30S ribosomal protein S5 [Planctomycetota bacterium]